MARTSTAAVEGILLADYDGESDLAPFIDTATVMVDRVAACATRKGQTLTAAELELVERWLAAHYYANSDKPYASKTTERASATFHGRTSMYLEATLYGQTAARVDPSGCLQAVAGQERKVASAFWVGKPRSEQTDYEDRD